MPRLCCGYFNICLHYRRQKNLVVEPAIFTCISMLARAVGTLIMADIRDLLEPMLAVGLRSEHRYSSVCIN